MLTGVIHVGKYGVLKFNTIHNLLFQKTKCPDTLSSVKQVLSMAILCSNSSADDGPVRKRVMSNVLLQQSTN